MRIADLPLSRFVLPLLTARARLRRPGVGRRGHVLFNDPPAQLLREKHGFEVLTGGSCTHAIVVRFNSGRVGSFVSADGMVMTNHHVGADALQSSPRRIVTS